MPTQIAPTADIDETATIGDGCVIWHLAQIREGVTLGPNCIVGRGAYVDTGVQVGRDCKIQNHALVYAPAELADGVFIGPAAVLTNDRNPRAVGVDGSLKGAEDWDPTGIRVGEGAAIGARAVVVAGVEIGSWSLVGAGSVVVRDVAAYALVVGNPGRQIGWVGHAGFRLEPDGDGWRCPQTGERYAERGDDLVAM